MRTVFVLFLLVFLGGCVADGLDLELPPGWETNGEDRWWTSSTDTLKAFRDLETLQAMGVPMEEVIYDATLPLAAQNRVGVDRMIRYVKQSLLPLFRNHPEIVDSLFNQYVTPRIRKTGTSRDPAGDVARFKQDGYRAIYRHFHEPRTILRVGEDISIEIPDSLRADASGRAVSFQVYVSEAGEPIGIELLNGVQPTLDLIGLKTTMAMRWQPAYLLKGRKSVPVPAWVRFRIRFPG